MPVNLEVISSAQAGDENSFEVILEDVSPIIKKLCGRYHHPSMDYNDIQQEALIALYQAIKDYRPERGNFYSFVRLVVERRLNSTLRSASRLKHEILTNSLSLDKPLNEDNITLYDLVSDQVNYEDLILEDLILGEENIIERLPLSHLEKTVLKLYLKYRSYTDIMAHTGQNYKSVDNTMSRIRSKLKKKYSQSLLS